MYTIGQLCKKYGLSRGTLLHYDTIGLLKPSKRTDVNYRVYSQVDEERLRQICLYRETGMSLEDIKQVLESTHNEMNTALEKRLADLNEGMRKLEIQRRIIVQMLKNQKTGDKTPAMEDVFVKILRNSGLNDANLEKLHIEFEKSFPEEHQVFLEFLGIPPDEIKLIREHAKS